MDFLMVPLVTLYVEYIVGQKWTEQKNPFAYIVPSPLKMVGTNKKNVNFQKSIF